jgi:hypothetical protein
MRLPVSALDALREQGRMTWLETQRAWFAAPDEVVVALASDGFRECKRELTTGRRDNRPVTPPSLDDDWHREGGGKA